MKTVYFLLVAKDKSWAKKIVQHSFADKEIVFVAPTFEGALVANELGLNCLTCEEIAWSLNKTKMHDDSRRMAYEWLRLDGIKNNSNIKAINEFEGYPLLLMHHSLLTLSMMEVLEAWKYVNQIIHKLRPDRIICGHRSHPFALDKNRLFALTGSKGLELEAIRIIATQHKIEFIELPTADYWSNLVGFVQVKQILKSGLRLSQRFIKQVIYQLTCVGISKKASIKSTNRNIQSRKILVNCYGGYYLDQIKDSLIKVAKNGESVVVNISGGEVSKQQILDFSMFGVEIISTVIPVVKRFKAAMVFLRLKRMTRRAMKDIDCSQGLSEYFTDEYGSFYPLALAAIKRELVNGVPLTAAALVSSEIVIDKYAPDVVVSQFDFHPFESCDVLPARKHGIPTLGMDHGVGGLLNTARHAFASEYVTSVGNAYAESLGRTYKSSAHKIFPVGDLRIDMMGPNKTAKMIKASFGLDPERPVCIFCDNSGWRMTNEWRNSEFKHAIEILRVKEARPNLQLIYRVHHGSDFQSLQKFLRDRKLDSVAFQVSPDPQFVEIVHAADLVITHFSSSIAETLVCGVPVIYLCALSQVEPHCLGYEAITVVQDFDRLGEAVDSILEKGWSREEVRVIANDYIDSNLCGNDGFASNRLAQKIIDLANMPKSSRNQGFKDWELRVDESSAVRMAELLK